MRQFDQALKELYKALEIDPQFLLAFWYSGMAYMNKGTYENAIEYLTRSVEISQGSTLFESYLALAYGLSGNVERANELIKQMRKTAEKEYVAPFHFARAYLGIKEYDRVFEELEKAYQDRNVGVYLPHAQEFDAIRSDPRFGRFSPKLRAKKCTVIHFA